MVGGVGIEPTEHVAPDLQSGPLPSTGYPPKNKSPNGGQFAGHLGSLANHTGRFTSHEPLGDIYVPYLGEERFLITKHTLGFQTKVSYVP